MKNVWEVKELAAVSAINYGYTESASIEPVGPRFLRITDIQDDRVDWEIVPYCKIQFEGIATAKANAEKNLQNAHALFESHLQAVLLNKKMETEDLGGSL
jgi:hypothetical protein